MQVTGGCPQVTGKKNHWKMLEEPTNMLHSHVAHRLRPNDRASMAGHARKSWSEGEVEKVLPKATPVVSRCEKRLAMTWRNRTGFDGGDRC